MSPAYSQIFFANGPCSCGEPHKRGHVSVNRLASWFVLPLDLSMVPSTFSSENDEPLPSPCLWLNSLLLILQLQRRHQDCYGPLSSQKWLSWSASSLWGILQVLAADDWLLYKDYPAITPKYVILYLVQSFLIRVAMTVPWNCPVPDGSKAASWLICVSLPVCRLLSSSLLNLLSGVWCYL